MTVEKPKEKQGRSPSISFLPEHQQEEVSNFIPNQTFSAYSAVHGPQPVQMNILLGLAFIGVFVRAYNIGNPSKVILDEGHYGEFLSNYINGHFFLDQHPPLGKLILAFVGVLFGYDGSFDFQDQTYTANIPYVILRFISAAFGALVAPMAYATMRNFGFSNAAGVLASAMIIFENAMTSYYRMIGVDSILIFFTASTTLLWSEFRRFKYEPFSNGWWKSLTLLGMSMAAALCVKWDALLTVAFIGAFSLGELWNIVNDGTIPLQTFQKHFFARFMALLVVPVLIYVTIFRFHLTLLSKEGPDAIFITPQFQAGFVDIKPQDTLLDVAFGSTVVLRHEATKNQYLHSHQYPYPAGSKQQQITCYPHQDKNNEFLIKLPLNIIGQNVSEQPIEGFQKIKHLDTIRLEHIDTELRLHSHDVRPTFTDDKDVNEVSAYGAPDVLGDANDHWKVEIDEAVGSNTELRAIHSRFKLRHVNTGCYLMSKTTNLPEWAFGQQEVSCSSKGRTDLTYWVIDSAHHPEAPSDAPKTKYEALGIVGKFKEYHQLMVFPPKQKETDNEPHPASSRPFDWPFMKKIIPVWSTRENNRLYIVGNPLVWFAVAISAIVYGAYLGIDLILSQRKIKLVTSGYYKDIMSGTWFFGAGYFLHFLPYIFIKTELFLNQYFVALYFGVLLAAGLFEFATYKDKNLQLILMVPTLLLLLYFFWQYSAVTFGSQVSGCTSLQLRSSWDFNCPLSK